MKIGIDFGGVLSITDTITTLKPHMNTSIDMPGAKEAIIELAKHHELFLISFCGKRRAIETKASIITAGIFDYFTSLYFVKHPEYKSQITKYIGCDLMIDDNIDVLDNISKHNDTIYTLLLLDTTHKNGHIHVSSWNNTVTLINSLDKRNVLNDKMIDITRFCYKI